MDLCCFNMFEAANILIFRESLKMSLPLCRLLPRQLHHSISRMTPGFGVSQVRYRSMFDKRTKRTLIELNKRRENVELNQLLKDGKVEHLKRAGEGLFNQKAELVALASRLGEHFDQRLLAEAMVTPGQVGIKTFS